MSADLTRSLIHTQADLASIGRTVALRDQRAVPGVYTGVGSRGTPADVISFMRSVGCTLAHRGWTLRSGAAKGADTAFESGVVDAIREDPDGVSCSHTAEIYLPWPTFALATLADGRVRPSPVRRRPTSQAWHLAAEHHPNWASLPDYACALHARNAHVVLGADLATPSRFLVCWTQDGADGIGIPTSARTRGTGQAIRIAAAYGVPVFNLQRPEHYKLFDEALG